MDITNSIITDVCILGAGAAGLSVALKLPKNNSVTVVASSRIGMSASAMAQGGIAAAVSPYDSSFSHAEDSVVTGATLADKDAIDGFVAGSVAEVAWLEKQGVKFNKNEDGVLKLRKDIGHNDARVVHVNDETGKAIMTVLQKNVSANENINILYEHTAIDLVVGGGEIVAVKLLNILTKEFVLVKSKCFVIASGGASGIFSRYTNPSRPIGGGIAIAWRAGCSVANMEFQHFHPTCFDFPKLPGLLISEALHGSGGNLLYASGNKFTPAYNSNGEFSPRDIVSRILFKYKKNTGQNAYIDVAGKQKKWLKNSCPSFYRTCFSYGIDIAQATIPVFPSAHYTCGGVVVDKNCLTTKFKNLYAVGEVAHTGLHGADRLCANALMECIVFATKAADHMRENIKHFKIHSDILELAENKSADFIFNEYNNCCHNVQALMWEGVGIVRSNNGLMHAKKELIKIKDKVDKIYLLSDSCHQILELRNMVLTALIMTQSAIFRKESRGVHYNEDYPSLNNSYNGVVSLLNSSFISFDESYSCV
jgi:L-aspartate oxidase